MILIAHFFFLQKFHRPPSTQPRTPKTTNPQRHKGEKVMVFFITCAAVDYFAALLERHPAFRALFPGSSNNSSEGSGSGSGSGSGTLAALHGKMVQKKRDGMLQRFTQANGGCVLLCTDVAARGLDVPNVSWIVQYEPPQVRAHTHE